MALQETPSFLPNRIVVAFWPVATAIGCLAACAVAPDVPIPVAGGILAAACVGRRALLLSIGIVLLCGALAGAAQADCTPLRAGAFREWVQLVNDPSEIHGAEIVDVRSEQGHVRLVARGSAAGTLRLRAAGDRVMVTGMIRSQWVDRSRHLRAMVSVGSVEVSEGETPLVSLINGLRRQISKGGRILPNEVRPLYLGLVIGDDRGASAQMTDDLRAAGLAHLAVVSGENLLFIMVLVSPMLSRVGMRCRLAVLLVVVVGFLSITRFEPSILRAAAMTLVAGVAISVGRSASPVRVMSLGVILVLALDPLIVNSRAFQLSLAATAGIVLLAGPITRRLPLPDRAAVALAIPIAAQLGVAPLAIPLFGPQPLLAIPANVLAEPAAALVMMWGCTVGMVAGFIGGPVGSALQLPAVLALKWILLVAHTTAGINGPRLGLAHLGALGAVVLAVWLLGRYRANIRTPHSSSPEFHHGQGAGDR